DCRSRAPPGTQCCTAVVLLGSIAKRRADDTDQRTPVRRPFGTDPLDETCWIDRPSMTREQRCVVVLFAKMRSNEGWSHAHTEQKPYKEPDAMRVEQVEIYSDVSNAAVMRHPGRRFPGVLVQGDTLYTLCYRADVACRGAKSRLDSESYEELNELRNHLWSLLSHYKVILGEHEIPLPFVEGP